MSTEQKKNLKFTTTVTVPFENIVNALCSAFEGGSNYWYRIEKFVKPENFDNSQPDEVQFKHLSYPVNKGGALVISNFHVQDEDKPITKTLNLKSIQKGLKVMAAQYPKHYSDLNTECAGDADTGDVFLQCCLFGKIVYG